MFYSSALVLTIGIEFWCEMHMTSLCCDLGVVRIIIHTMQKMTKQKGYVKLVSCKSLLFKEEIMGPEKKNDLLKAMLLFNDRAATGAPVC